MKYPHLSIFWMSNLTAHTYVSSEMQLFSFCVNINVSKAAAYAVYLVLK